MIWRIGLGVLFFDIVLELSWQKTHEELAKKRQPKRLPSSYLNHLDYLEKINHGRQKTKQDTPR